MAAYWCYQWSVVELESICHLKRQSNRNFVKNKTEEPEDDEQSYCYEITIILFFRKKLTLEVHVFVDDNRGFTKCNWNKTKFVIRTCIIQIAAVSRSLTLDRFIYSCSTIFMISSPDLVSGLAPFFWVNFSYILCKHVPVCKGGTVCGCSHTSIACVMTLALKLMGLTFYACLVLQKFFKTLMGGVTQLYGC